MTSRGAVIILVSLLCFSARAQEPFRTFAVERIRNLEDSNSSTYTVHWSFYYNDAGVLDSLLYSSRGNRYELGGLTKMKPFIRELYDWETLPPNIGGFANEYSSNQRLVITEPEEGKMRVYKSTFNRGDSAVEPLIISYNYDPHTQRLLFDGLDTLNYRDSAGRIVEIKRGRELWKLYRDTDGVIIGIELLRPRFKRDSLVMRQWHQILSWKPHGPWNSARRGQHLFFNDYFTKFPWLSEGEPAAWLTWEQPGSSISGPRLYESAYDSLGRLTRESSSRNTRTIVYHDTGPIQTDRSFEGSQLESYDRLVRRRPSNGVVWRDFVIENLTKDLWRDGVSHSFQYEYGYRYGDSILGDRMAHDLFYDGDHDTITLTINAPLSTEGLTASLIDTTETEIAQIPLTGRKTIYILPPSVSNEMFAVRWKYHGFKVVDQAFY
jgi:hypothetical protein